MITKLLEYQAKDKERIEAIAIVETGKIKREINGANKILSDARGLLLKLEEEAQSMTANYENLSKSLDSALAEFKKLDTSKEPSSDEELQNLVATASALSAKINMIEGQMHSLSSGISAKVRQCEDAKASGAKAQNTVKVLTPQYEAQLNEIKPRLDSIEKELAGIASGIDKIVIDKYKSRRKSEPVGKVSDIVVSLLGERCSGCMVEMPLALVHKISTDGYIICEECGKIIYKA